MPINITPVTNHREREKGLIVYPVYSRRSAGLSIGINLFTDKKTCLFDCPYCEVFPFADNAVFSLEQMEAGLKCAIASAQEQNVPVKDICFSGNGEPTLSPHFKDALKLAQSIRAETASDAKLVVITNGTGLLQSDIFSLLKDAAISPLVDIWLKLDAGTPDWYQRMNRCAVPYDNLINIFKDFTSCAVVTIQTMLCAVKGDVPAETEERAWEALICKLAANSENNAGGIRKVQLYGKARPAPEDPSASRLPDEYLEKRAASLRRRFAEKNITTPVEIFI
ncbi:MAG: hypothetical protein FWC06_06410 [Treponema sp.]|nr:hypothetical protein [Treponema sp.]